MLNAQFTIKKCSQLNSYLKQVFYSKISIKRSAEIIWRYFCRYSSQKSEGEVQESNYRNVDFSGNFTI